MPQNAADQSFCRGCGSSLLLQNRYRAVELLGWGSSGRTFRAIDQSVNQSCVVKQLSAEVFPPEQVAQLPKLAELRQVVLPPQLPKLLDSLQQNGLFYWVQEYIAGKNLAIIRQEHPISAKQIEQLLYGLLPVLANIHERGWTHQDIKPENIIVRSDTLAVNHKADTFGHRLVLVDFGAALLLPDHTSMNIGSPAFAAPEQLQGRANSRSDLYGLGVTCIHLLTNLPPFELFDPVHQRWHWRDCWTPEVTDATGQFQQRNLADLLDRLIAPNPADRVASATEALAILSPASVIQLTTRLPPDWQCCHSLTGHTGLFASVNAIAIDSANQQLVSGSDDKTVRLWDIPTGTFQFNLLHPQAVLAVAFDPQSSDQLVTGCRDRLVRLWNLPDREVVATLSGHTAAVTAIGFSPVREILCSGSADKTIRLWHSRTGKPLATLAGHRLAVQALAFSSTAPLIASASADSTTMLWNLDSLERIAKLEGHTQRLRAVAFSPDGQLLATGGEDRSIRLWEVGSWRCIRTLSGHPWSVSALAFSPDGRLLLSGSWDKTVKLWQVETGQEIASLTEHQDSVTCIAITSNGKMIASGSQDSTIRLYQRVLL